MSGFILFLQGWVLRSPIHANNDFKKVTYLKRLKEQIRKETTAKDHPSSIILVFQ